MNKGIKKLLVIVFILLLGVNSNLVNAKAANSFEINGVSVHYSDFSSSPRQCFAYAKNVYTKIWGVSFTGYTTTHNLLNGLSAQEKKLTEENLKNHISHSALGAAIRITNYSGLYSSSDYVGHSQVLVQKDENGFTVVEGGFSAAPHRREKYYTWSEYCKTWSGGNYGYLKYVVWPHAIPLVEIDPEIKAELLADIEEMKNNDPIKKALNAQAALYENINEVAVSEVEAINGPQVTINRYGFSLLVVASTFYSYIGKRNDE